MEKKEKKMKLVYRLDEKGKLNRRIVIHYAGVDDETVIYSPQVKYGGDWYVCFTHHKVVDDLPMGWDNLQTAERLIRDELAGKHGQPKKSFLKRLLSR